MSTCPQCGATYPPQVSICAADGMVLAHERTTDPSVVTNVHSASNTSWTEGGLTWNNKPSAGSTVRGVITVVGMTPGWYEVDLTSFIQTELAAGRKVVTLVLKNPTITDAWPVFSSDETANGPRLVVA